MASQQKEETSKKDEIVSNDANESKPRPASDKKNEAGEANNLDQSTQMTCDVLCSLMGSAPTGAGCPNDEGEGDGDGACDGKLSCGGMGDGPMLCSKQMQLPMFLSKTYHMISRSDATIACWSESGDNFVIKNVDKFSASVLPLYFKHSNFSSFARQLNFYGFRKMRSDPILTSDVDPETAGHVRFFHPSFQRGKPDLLQHIKRATKTDQQSKDEIDSLRQEVASLREALSATTSEYERRLAELSYDFNRRLSATTVEFDNLVETVHRLLYGQDGGASASTVPAAAVEGGKKDPDALHSLSRIATLQDRAAATNHAAGTTPATVLQPPGLGAFSLARNNFKRAAEGTALPAPGASRPRLS